MKIFFVVNVDWFFISHRLCIAEAAIANGHSVHIGTKISSTKNAEFLRDKGLIVHNIPFDRSASLLGFLKASLVLSKLYLSIKPDLVHLVTSQPVILGGILAKFHRINSVVFSISGLGHVFIGLNRLNRLRRLVVLYLYKFASLFQKTSFFSEYEHLSILMYVNCILLNISYLMVLVLI